VGFPNTEVPNKLRIDLTQKNAHQQKKEKFLYNLPRKIKNGVTLSPHLPAPIRKRRPEKTRMLPMPQKRRTLVFKAKGLLKGSTQQGRFRRMVRELADLIGRNRGTARRCGGGTDSGVRRWRRCCCPGTRGENKFHSKLERKDRNRDHLHPNESARNDECDCRKKQKKGLNCEEFCTGKKGQDISKFQS